jgi:hypothetical protein
MTWVARSGGAFWIEALLVAHRDDRCGSPTSGVRLLGDGMTPSPSSSPLHHSGEGSAVLSPLSVMPMTGRER